MPTLLPPLPLPLQINPPPAPIGGGEMTSLLRTFATSCYRALLLYPPLLLLLPRVLAHFDVPKSKYRPRPHILKMSAQIYGPQGEAGRFRPPRIQIVLFFGGFLGPGNRVAWTRTLFSLSHARTNKHRCRAASGATTSSSSSSHRESVRKEVRREESD